MDYHDHASRPRLNLYGTAVDKLQWSTPLSVIKYPDPRLRAVNAKIAVFDDTLKQLAAQMFEIMYQ